MPTILLGGSALGTNGTDFENAGVIIATKRVAVATGTVNEILIRSRATTTAPSSTASLKACLYTDSAGAPGTKIGTETATLGPQTWALATWYTLTGASAAVTNGTTYWIAFLVGGSGSWQFSLNDATTANGTKDTATGQSSLPASYPAVAGSFTEIINAYGQDSGGGAIVVPRRSAALVPLHRSASW